MLSAHGLGGGDDLPIPASLAIAGGTAALTISFVVLMLAWRKPRFDDPTGEYVVPRSLASFLDSRALTVTLRLAGLMFLGFMLWPALFGPDLLINPTFGVVYVWLWVGLVPASLLFGPVIRAVSPVRTVLELLDRAMGRSPDTLRPYPASLGYWPAALGLFAFVWLELVAPGAAELGVLRVWFAIYAAAMLIGWAFYGTVWLVHADPFESYSTLVSHLSPWSRSVSGQLVLVSPLRNLARVKPKAGLVAVVAVLLGSTAYDSWSSSLTWVRFVQSNNVDVTRLGTALMALIILVVGVSFTLACVATAVNDQVISRRMLPRTMAHSILPIIVGYMVAHYLTYLVEIGQRTLIQLSDPMADGSDLFGTADWGINFWLSQNPTVLASIKVSAIVVGHVLGVIAAHDRALRVLPARHQVTGQLALLLAMTLYTFMGLFLLFGA
ncbi:hypothetical protein IEQ44_06355 [Nocardioides sp. Y6]|uniref:Fenitrothion hydrolase n=1 Tax=Nocardioides malaquae TaxID=2773426 RepID=A0ABR9RRS4_9ACTN|nr:hypothetical protein [Nocardioides malaquae]MBE7324268.1 hypothetical protein [Nocardioides malaquae]